MVAVEEGIEVGLDVEGGLRFLERYLLSDGGIGSACLWFVWVVGVGLGCLDGRGCFCVDEIVDLYVDGLVNSWLKSFL